MVPAVVNARPVQAGDAAQGVSYRSNRPNVVAVGRDGKIRTTGTGIATVTATARYNGTTVSTGFVVHLTR